MLTMGQPRITLRWIVEFVFEQPGWANQLGLTDGLADTLAATGLISLVDFVGRGYDSAMPRVEADDLRALLRTGQSRYAFVRGSRRAATFVDETDVSLQLNINPRFLAVKGSVGDGPLRELGARALDDFVDVAAKLAQTFVGWGHLVRGNAWIDSSIFPELGTQSSWPLWALADAAEPNRPPTHDADPFVAPANAIAAAAAPDGVKLHSTPVTILRWARDPSDAKEIDRAGTQRAAWMRAVLPPE